MGLPRRDVERHTYGDYRNWPEELRYELIDGFAYTMSPAPTRRHQEIVGELFRIIADALDGSSCRPYLALFDVRLPKAGEADDAVDTVVQPDLSIICDKSKLDDRGCRGAPEWIVEVLSPSTASHDQILKRAAYERAGVREYWLVHPEDSVVTVYVLLDGAYGKPDVFELAADLPSRILPNVVVSWARVLREA